MNSLLFYLLQVIAASGLLYGYYHFALRNKKFHRYNRSYLLMAVVISSLIPFLNIPVYFSANETGSSVVLQTLQVISSPAVEETITPAIQAEPVTSSWFNDERLVYLFYILAILFFLIRVFISLNKIRSIIKRNPVEQIDKIKFLNTDEPGTPFSFFRWLFWNRKIELHSEKGEQIFRHELFHIQQGHSWDIIFMELISTIFWINPFFHLLKKELKAVHEFLADEFAIKENKNWQYAELLLMQVLNTNTPLVNPFFHNQIKRRIAMITSSTKPSYQYLRKLMVLPVAAIIVTLFAFNYRNKTQQKDDLAFQSLQNKNEGDTSKPKELKGINEYENYLIVINGIVQSKKGFKAIDSSVFFAKDGVEITVYKDSTGIKKYGQKGKDGVIEVTTNKNSAKTGIKEVVVTETGKPQPTIYKLVEVPVPTRKSPTLAELKSWADSKMYGVWVDVNRISNTDLEKYKPSDFCWYNVSKLTKNAINYGKHYYQVSLYSQKYYDEKINNGKERPLILVRDVTLADTTKPKKEKPLIVINGTPMPNLKMADLDKIILSPNDIESISILKGDTAIKKYGDIGKNDAIEIKTKKLTPITQKNETLNEIRADGKGDQDDDNKVFVKLEVEPSFPGGEREWRRYLEKNLDASLPLKNGCRSGTYTVMTQFIVDQNGNISDVRPLTRIGYGMEEHVMSLIKKGPNWVPGIQNGRNVKAYKTQPVTFVIGNGKPDNSKSITNKPGEKTILNEVVVKSFENDENIVLEKVEIEARFPGGANGWREFLQKNLKSTIPVDSGANTGTYTVITQFIVHKDGSISDLKTLTNHGHGMEDEVLRVMKRSPNWIPAVQNGCNVTAYRKQPITFVIADE